MLKGGDVILATVQYTDSFQTKVRPAVVLFEDHGNVVVAGVTSNEKMDGVPLTKKEGAIKDSVIKLNYIFTISHAMIQKSLFSLSEHKWSILREAIVKKLQV